MGLAVWAQGAAVAHAEDDSGPRQTARAEAASEERDDGGLHALLAASAAVWLVVAASIVLTLVRQKKLADTLARLEARLAAGQKAAKEEPCSTSSQTKTRSS